MPGRLRVSEWIALAYFLYLIALAAVARVSVARRQRVLATAPVTCAAIATIGLQAGTAAALARDWLPLLYLVMAYWLPAQLVETPRSRVEARLLRFDHKLFRSHRSAAAAARAPRLLVEYLELAYLLCYPVVPAGFACLVLCGFRAEADQYWTAVLLAALPCYGLLPWLPTRPPRAIEMPETAARSAIRALNVKILDRASVQLNTFPSGHAAASIAIALAVGSHVLFAGAVLGIVAVSIAAGSVIGRYHYAADVIAGAGLAIGAFAASRLIG